MRQGVREPARRSGSRRPPRALGARRPAFLGSSTSISRRSDGPIGPAARDSTTILPPCCTSRVAVASPAARSSSVVSQPGPPIPTTTSSAGAATSVCHSRSTLAIPRSRTEVSRPAMTSAMPEAAGTSPTWNPLPKSQLTSNDSSRAARPPAAGPSSAAPSTGRDSASIVSRSDEPRKNDAPWAAVAHDRVETDSPDGNHDVGIDHRPVQVDAPSFLGGRQIHQLTAIARIVNDQRDPARQLPRDCKFDPTGATTVTSPGSTPPWARRSTTTAKIVAGSAIAGSNAMATRSPGTTICRAGG